MQISLLYKYTRKYKYHCGSSLLDVFAFNETEFLQTNCHFFLTEHKEFLKDNELALAVALFFVLLDFDGLE